MKNYSVAVVGATGLVGRAFLALLLKRKFPVSDLRLFASHKSKDRKIQWGQKIYTVQSLSKDCFKGVDFAFFSSGDSVSLKWAPEALKAGATVIDNSAAFRMNPKYKLIVPEINGFLLDKKNRCPEIIANPNCSTIQLVMVLKPLLDDFGVSQVYVSSYQSVSGAGLAALEELKAETKAVLSSRRFKTKEFVMPIAFNTIPQIGRFDESGFCTEEVKIMQESKKILGTKKLKVSAFTVRVPTLNGHAQSVWIQLKRKISHKQILQSLAQMPGLKIQAQSTNYPTVRFNSDEFVHVGRIHRDLSNAKTWLMWIVSDNLLKGAALNAIQIAESLIG